MTEEKTWQQNLNKLSKECHAIAKSKGFYDMPPTVLESLMLIVTEVAEAAESIRRDPMQKIADEHCPQFSNFEVEIADTIIRLLDLTGYMEINIEKVIEVKMEYNKTRPYKHGKSC